MPMFVLECSACNGRTRILATKRPESWGGCKVAGCPGDLHRVGAGPSAQVVEHLDNGAMPRALDRLADAERLHKERSLGGDALAGTPNRTVGS